MRICKCADDTAALFSRSEERVDQRSVVGVRLHAMAGTEQDYQNMLQENTINLTLHHLGEEYRVQTSRARHHSLMTLIADELAIPGFGLCCGMGSCGTCIVQIANHNSSVKRSVMACSVLVNDDLANVDVYIPDRMY